MPRTVDEGFRDFLFKLTPTTGETEAAKRHRASIKVCLENNFNMKRFFRTGSFGNGTSISGYSDVDYFAVIPTENLSHIFGSALNKHIFQKIPMALEIKHEFERTCYDGFES